MWSLMVLSSTIFHMQLRLQKQHDIACIMQPLAASHVANLRDSWQITVTGTCYLYLSEDLNLLNAKKTIGDSLMPLKFKASSATKIYSIKSLTLLNSKANKAVENRTHPG